MNARKGSPGIQRGGLGEKLTSAMADAVTAMGCGLTCVMKSAHNPFESEAIYAEVARQIGWSTEDVKASLSAFLGAGLAHRR